MPITTRRIENAVLPKMTLRRPNINAAPYHPAAEKPATRDGRANTIRRSASLGGRPSATQRMSRRGGTQRMADEQGERHVADEHHGADHELAGRPVAVECPGGHELEVEVGGQRTGQVGHDGRAGDPPRQPVEALGCRVHGPNATPGLGSGPGPAAAGVRLRRPPRRGLLLALEPVEC